VIITIKTEKPTKFSKIKKKTLKNSNHKKKPQETHKKSGKILNKLKISTKNTFKNTSTAVLVVTDRF
jgi:hypothetical protein